MVKVRAKIEVSPSKVLAKNQRVPLKVIKMMKMMKIITLRSFLLKLDSQ